MKTLLTTALLSLGLTLAPAKLHSHLLIEAGKQFLLGGGQPGAFKVAGENVGPGPVEIREQPRAGAAVRRGLLAPGRKAQVAFAAGSTAVLVNLGTQQAVLELDVTGDTKALRMDYEPASR